ncbi:MAG: CoA transferase [Proteobacteria bacterium]|nr:CoA transferase [Pseudomonadota bacterium]
MAGNGAGGTGGNLPLSGVTVLDFGQIFQGPYATLLMARAGADVVKIEPPRGEPLRRRADPGVTNTVSTAILNSCKRAITLDLKHERGKALLRDLVKRADVLLENFAPGVMDKLGVGWEALHAVNPRLIYATGTGFGISGPDRDNLAMDFTIQAASGIMSVTGAPDGPPMKAGPTLVDIMGGTALYAGIVTALLDRARTGQGRLVEVAMQEAVYPALTSQMEYYVRTGKVPQRTGNRQTARSVAPYNAYPTTDGYVVINVITEEHWPKLLQAMGREDLIGDARYDSHPKRIALNDEVDEIVSAWTRTLPRAEVFRIASRFRIPCAPVRDVADVMDDPHMHERGMLERIEHPELGPLVVPVTPLRLHGIAPAPTVPSPRTGEHNAQIYGGWLGLSEREIAALRAEGVI